MVCLESVGNLLSLPLLHENKSGKSGSQFCHFYQQKVQKKSEIIGEVTKLAKISSKKVAPLLTNLIQMKIDRIVTRNYSEHILYMDAFFSVVYNKTSVKYRRLIS